MTFWSEYWSSLKSRDVEEPIDVWVHRPLAWIVTKALQPTPVTPNQVTLMSIAFGVAAGVWLTGESAHRLQIGAACVFLSAVFDCADGQLARLRGTSSALGRMLDGMADLVTMSVIVVGAITWLHRKHAGDPLWHAWWLGLAVTTVYTSSFHTVSYDHYKNVFSKFTVPTFRDAEDWDEARARFSERWRTDPWYARPAWPVYLFYVRTQFAYIHGADPYTPTKLRALPPYSAENAAIYRKHCEPCMRVWRTWFGFGALVFGVSLAIGFDAIEAYCLLRCIGQNAAFYLWLRPKQRAASRAALEELGIPIESVAVGV